MKRKYGGFTLLEVMIVVAIIALVAVIAVPNYLKSRLQTQDGLCVANMKVLLDATQMADMENDFPVGQIMDISDIKEGGYAKGNPLCPLGPGPGGANYTFFKVADGSYYVMCPAKSYHSDRWKNLYYQGFDGTEEGRGRHAD